MLCHLKLGTGNGMGSVPGLETYTSAIVQWNCDYEAGKRGGVMIPQI